MTITNDSIWLPIATLWRREVIAFLRKKSRIVGALGTPIVFWLLIGSGFRDSIKMGDAAGDTNYLVYAFPGTIVLVVLFTAIFSMISVIEDRRAGFMQAVLVAPISRTAIVAGKVLGCSTLAIGQGLILLLLAPFMGVTMTPLTFIAVVGVLILLSLGLSGLGFLVAWPMDSTQGFHAVMNLFLMPMWLLSGAFFPATGAATWIRWIMTINPLTYGVATLRHAMYGEQALQTGSPSLPLSLGVTIVFAVLMLVLSTLLVNKKRSE